MAPEEKLPGIIPKQTKKSMGQNDIAMAITWCMEKHQSDGNKIEILIRCHRVTKIKWFKNSAIRFIPEK